MDTISIIDQIARRKTNNSIGGRAQGHNVIQKEYWLKHLSTWFLNRLTPHQKDNWSQLPIYVCIMSDRPIAQLNPPCPTHYNDVIMRMTASQITNVSMVCSNVCSGACQWKHQSSASHGLCEGNPPVTNGFPSQRASDAENVSNWWRYQLHLFGLQ